MSAKRKTSKGSVQSLTRAALRRKAGSVYFARGEGYFERGAVRNLREDDGTIKATVKGTRTYKISLLVHQGRLDGRCTCPLGQDEEFCKHLVAAGLTYIEQQKTTSGKPKRRKSISQKDIEAYLSKQDTAELVRIIMDQADYDDEFYARLKLRTAIESRGADIADMKRALDLALSIDDFVSWDETFDYSQRVDRVLDQLRTMLTPGRAAGVIELAEHAMDLWEENIESIDDSDGCMGVIRDDLHELHLKACRIAKPDPVPLADRLARRAITSGWEMFYDAYQTHNRIFKKAGRQRFREIVTHEWEKLPTVKPGEKDPNPHYRRTRLEQMMLSFADEDNDLDLAIRVISRDLSIPYTYLRIAERCKTARNYKLARTWAEL